MRRLLILFLLALPLCAANIKLYLKDGDFHLVREYQVNGDRVRFYSLDVGDWDEMPVSLIDLKRTETEAAASKAIADKDAKAISDEEAAPAKPAPKYEKFRRTPDSIASKTTSSAFSTKSIPWSITTKAARLSESFLRSRHLSTANPLWRSRASTPPTSSMRTAPNSSSSWSNTKTSPFSNSRRKRACASWRK